ncbi:MAG: DUF349 domain-containing protein [Bacteroidota bacterium]
MKTSENTPRNPELEITSDQEEIIAALEITADNTETTLPSDVNQAEMTQQTDDVPLESVFPAASVEVDIAPVIEEAIDEIPVAVEISETADLTFPLVTESELLEYVEAEPTSLETPEQIEIEPTSLEAPEQIEIEPTSSESQEHVENVLYVADENSGDLLLETMHEEHLEEHPDEVTEDNMEHLVVESDVNYDSFSRDELVGLLEQAVAETDFNAVKTRIALIKVAFLKKKKEESLEKYELVSEEGGTKEELSTEPDALEVKFNELFNIYRANKIKFAEEQEKIKQYNLKRKFEILDSLKALISSEETLKKTYDEFKILQDRWKEIGMVPRTEINNLWQNYHFLVEKFFEKVKLNKELKDLDLKKNLEAKISVCERTEELLLETSIIRSFRKLQKYHEDWKEIGPVPADKKDEIWERFKNATDKINDRRREHYALVEDEQNRNMETKIALCEQGEVILELKNDSIKEWQDNTNKVNDLLKIWKNIGPVPQKMNVEIWTRFKASLDAFFAVKKEYFDKLKEQQMHNYNLKVELCMQAEALNTSVDWKKTTNELIRLQNDWKNIGPVPKKHSDKLWKRFRSACDAFFNTKQAYFSNMQASETENLNKKIDLLTRLREFQFGENKTANLDVLKNFQREWTEIGHVPMKEKDRLHNEFRSLINEQMDKLKISDVEMSAASYQARFDHMKNDPNARRVIGKEKETLAMRITKMKDEITLWENNIGFFAKSKSAAIVREEFEHKINMAKSELKVLEAKMKIMKQQGGL